MCDLILTLKNSRYDTYSKPSLLSFCFIMILKCICNTYRRKKSICMEDHLQQKKIKTTGACIQKPIEKLYYSFCQNAKIWPNSSRIWKEKLVWFTRERLCWDNKMLHSETLLFLAVMLKMTNVKQKQQCLWLRWTFHISTPKGAYALQQQLLSSLFPKRYLQRS